MPKLSIGFFIFLFCLIYFSFRLLDVPEGITIDEAAFGYNAALISETLRDENGRFLPVFVLSLDGRDWRQPVTQYFQVAIFKIFGKSLFNLKFVSVLAASFSAVMIYLLGSKIFRKKFGLLALIIFVTTPVIMIHSHLALDNIMPLPFILLWLFGLWNFNDKKKYKYLLLAGISLGISFYAHKSMRSAAPIWTLLSAIYLAFLWVKNWKLLTYKNYKPVVIFLISIAPFYLISPILEYKYAGAVYGNQTLFKTPIYDFIYFYISNFDLAFLFIKGDTIMHHSTGVHGMFLLMTLPIFIYGIYRSFKEKNTFFIFLTIYFFAGPLLLGFIGSIHRASRIIFLVPLFSLISAYGLLKFLDIKSKVFKLVMGAACFLFIFNFYDFIKYYWFRYAGDTYNIFYSPVGINAYKKLYEVSKKEKLNPLISESLLETGGDGGTVEDFSRALYFVHPVAPGNENQLPENSILLTNKPDLKLENIDSGVKGYYIYVTR